MSKQKTIMLENTSPSVEQKCWDSSGNDYVLHPYEIKSVREDIANLFMNQCPGRVMVFSSIDVPREPGVEEVWVANNTGNPSLPGACSEETFDASAKVYVKRMVPNPVADAQPVRFRYNPGQILDDVGKKMWNQPPKMIVLPAYTRRPLPMSIVQAWFTATSAFGHADGGSPVVLSRAPTEFEARETWELDDLIYYGEMLRAGFKNKLGLKFAAEHAAVKDDTTSLDILVDKDRETAWRNIYFFLIDPQCTLPAESAFNKSRAGQEAKRRNEKPKGS